MNSRKQVKKPRIGIYSMGLKHYWGQFPGLRERLIEYGDFIGGKVQEFGADTCFYGLVDCEQEGKKAGEYFNENHVDLILAHSAIYVTSASVLPLHQICLLYTSRCV